MSDWQDELPDELKTNATLRNFETPEAAYQGLIDLKSKQGGMIRLSSDDAGDDERSSNRDKIMKAHPDLMLRPDWTDEAATKDYLAYQGVPTESNGYEIPENTLPPEWIEKITSTAIVEELTPRQFALRIKQMNTAHDEQVEAGDAALLEEQNTLKTKWGAAHEDRMKQIEWVNKEFFAEFGELGTMNNVALQGLYKVALALQGKGAQAHSQPHTPEVSVTPDEAIARVTELRQKIIENKVPSDKEKLTKRMVEMQKLTKPAAYA